jgi:hypothetical protein
MSAKAPGLPCSLIMLVRAVQARTAQGCEDALRTIERHSPLLVAGDEEDSFFTKSKPLYLNC